MSDQLTPGARVPHHPSNYERGVSAGRQECMPIIDRLSVRLNEAEKELKVLRSQLSKGTLTPDLALGLASGGEQNIHVTTEEVIAEDVPPPKYPHMKMLTYGDISETCGYTADQMRSAFRRGAAWNSINSEITTIDTPEFRERLRGFADRIEVHSESYKRFVGYINSHFHAAVTAKKSAKEAPGTLVVSTSFDDEKVVVNVHLKQVGRAALLYCRNHLLNGQTIGTAPFDGSDQVDTAPLDPLTTVDPVRVINQEHALREIASISFQRLNMMRENTDPAILKIREITKVALSPIEAAPSPREGSA